jgi:hypothetical protein
MQMGLMNVIIGAAMVLLVLQWPRLTTWADYGLFLSTMVVLTHWHYGTTFVLFHLGPTISLNKGLLDSSVCFILLGIPLSVNHPAAWFILSGSSYAVAWIKYRRTCLEDYPPDVRDYIKRKSWVEVTAVAGSLVGALWSWKLPDLTWVAAWSAFILNIGAILFLVNIWRLYEVGWEAKAPSVTGSGKSRQ